MILSFILCSRNDNYMGNPVGRLETVLNYLAENVHILGKEDCVEVIVTDWGSKEPLKCVLKLNAAASKITRFLEVPISVVKEVQKDSPFAEVLALNAAARRTSGQYIGRIDQDTLVGIRFLRMFFEWIAEVQKPAFDLKGSFLFSRRRQIPFSFANQNPSIDQVSTLIKWFGSLLLVESGPLLIQSPVGIMLLHKQLWEECGGYDERLLYWGGMEIDMAYRLHDKYPIVDLGQFVGNDFYHLEHYDSRLPRTIPRRINPKVTVEGLTLSPNESAWGLLNYRLRLQSSSGNKNGNAETISPNRVKSRNAFLIPAALVNAALSYIQQLIKDPGGYGRGGGIILSQKRPLHNQSGTD